MKPFPWKDQSWPYCHLSIWARNRSGFFCPVRDSSLICPFCCMSLKQSSVPNTLGGWLACIMDSQHHRNSCLMLWGAWFLPLTTTRAVCGAPVLACKEVSVSLQERDLGCPEVLSAIGGAPGTCWLLPSPCHGSLPARGSQQLASGCPSPFLPCAAACYAWVVGWCIKRKEVSTFLFCFP